MLIQMIIYHPSNFLYIFFFFYFYAITDSIVRFDPVQVISF